MLVMVGVADHRNDAADHAIFCRRSRHENRHECVTGKVARTTDAIHDASAHDVRGIDVAKDVDFDGGIHGNGS